MSLPQLTGSNRKSKNKKPVPKWQSWENQALDKKFLIFTSILGVFVLVLLVMAGFFIHRAMGSRPAVVEIVKPNLVNSRPPEFVQPFICDISAVRAGTVRMFAKNYGNFPADHVTPTFSLHLVPERKVGILAFDRIPQGDCTDLPFGIPAKAPIAAGKESVNEVAWPASAMPPLVSGDAVQMYGLNCVFYADRAGGNHAACDTYRFKLASGTPVFMCDGTPKTGTFDAASISNCGN